MSETLKKCQDCRFSVHGGFWIFKFWDLATCHHPEMPSVGFGKHTESDWYLCSTNRNHECGREAKHFKPRGHA